MIYKNLYYLKEMRLLKNLIEPVKEVSSMPWLGMAPTYIEAPLSRCHVISIFVASVSIYLFIQ